MNTYDNITWERPEPAFPLLPDDSSVMWVPTPDGVKPSIAYTIGLGSRPGRAYEVAAFGLPLHLAYSMVLSVAERLVAHCQDPAEGLEDGASGQYRVRLRRVQDTSGLEGVGSVPVWQVVASDKWGRFPDDPHHDASDPYVQPLP